MVEDTNGSGWIIVGFVVSAVIFVAVLFTFPQVSSLILSLAIDDSEYEKMNLGSAHIPLHESSISDISDNSNHRAQLRISSNSIDRRMIVYVTEENGSTTVRVNDFSQNQKYQSYWTSNPSELNIKRNFEANTTYRFERNFDGTYSVTKDPRIIELPQRQLYTELYNENITWAPVKISSRYGRDVIVYSVMKMPHQSSWIPITKYKSGKVYVDRKSGVILEAKLQHNLNGDPTYVYYSVNSTPQSATSYKWISNENF